MKVSYYPGCSLHATAREYDESTRAVSGALGVDLEELPDWNCCGASSAHATDARLALDLASRNLTIANKRAMDLVVPCAACYNRLKAAARDRATERHGERAGAGEADVRVLSLLEFLTSQGFSDNLAGLVRRPLSGLRVVSYYGCLLVRPPKTIGALRHENPENMDKLMTLLGATPVPWSYKTDCCGGSLVLSKKEIVLELTGKLLKHAAEAGAEAIAVACPLCQSNLDTRQEDLAQSGVPEMPALYFTEMIGLAFGLPDAGRWMRRHFVDPTPLLTSRGLL